VGESSSECIRSLLPQCGAGAATAAIAATMCAKAAPICAKTATMCSIAAHSKISNNFLIYHRSTVLVAVNAFFFPIKTRDSTSAF